MKKIKILVAIVLLVCVNSVQAQNLVQNVKNYHVDLELSQLKLNNTILLSDIAFIDQTGQPFLNTVSGSLSVEKLDYDSWSFRKGNDKFRFDFTQKATGPDEWDLAKVDLTESSSSLTIDNVNFAIGDNISKLNSLYPQAYNQRGLNPRNNLYCAILQINDLSGGISLIYDQISGNIYQIRFTMLTH